ncbi:hypothetical protein A2W54_02500 [Candidatus Giovannonibacteria bacterium RIFCSPHIGHO2_02_43_13]|uniref:Uncharacterized protein n=2 Tax=Parcubacteria group TaxID=1794811 RepID=A0A1F5WTD9_9BACT|nr:MAG: hypothetical protein UY66_C0035G0015 [Parcubacteria group bacterium GW2011_GWC1_51_35]KKW24823.1 MAG: hypothetical protein UY68_C0007G0001 [Parcubacteria group bacterium GW2011_GWF2_52_12]KKW27832.1 MAG: hypothetical protein UY69_C0004G0001 [Parcubacteria group bacterium GW2011_GWF1_52_5]KKW33913.1 MAG: hypothetical protein UY80_C0029G0013 [Parcubacteria group bacterium GW2011_GWB1_53_43]KKW38296.1 MAG: hypothetical protein UY88_C0015G0013 [Parcubacteria group bacterium GW2011_GWA1_54_8
MQPQKAVETEVEVVKEDELKEIKPAHATPKRDELKKVRWDAPTNSYAFEMGFHPDNCAGF